MHWLPSFHHPRARNHHSCYMITNTQHEPGSTAVSFTPTTNRDKGSQPPPCRPFQPYNKSVTLGHTYTLECRKLGFNQALPEGVQTVDAKALPTAEETAGLWLCAWAPISLRTCLSQDLSSDFVGARYHGTISQSQL